VILFIVPSDPFVVGFHRRWYRGLDRVVDRA
jgi:hypothetical protein